MTQDHLEAAPLAHEQADIVSAPAALSLAVVGWSLSLFLVISYVLCVLYGLLVPSYPMHPAWSAFLPGFVWLSWSSFALGLIEVFAYGWYAAVVFVPLYNAFAKRLRRAG